MKREVSKRIINIIIGIALILAFVSWIFICFSDYQNYKDNKDPEFCIKNETEEYNGGTINKCIGPGYKVVKYQKNDSEMVEFLPIWFDESIK